jgi:hypothetical protein
MCKHIFYFLMESRFEPCEKIEYEHEHEHGKKVPEHSFSVGPVDGTCVSYLIQIAGRGVTSGSV